MLLNKNGKKIVFSHYLAKIDNKYGVYWGFLCGKCTVNRGCFAHFSPFQSSFHFINMKIIDIKIYLFGSEVVLEVPYIYTKQGLGPFFRFGRFTVNKQLFFLLALAKHIVIANVSISAKFVKNTCLPKLDVLQ